MERMFRVFHAPNSCPNERRRIVKDGENTFAVVPDVIVRYDGQEFGPIAEGNSMVMPEGLANHAKAYFPWLELQETQAEYRELGAPVAVSGPAHDCPFCGYETNDFAAYSKHVKEHAEKKPATDAEAMAQVDRRAAEAQRGPSGPNPAQAPTLGHGRR